MKTEGRDVNPDQVAPHVVHPGLHQDYDLDFRMQRVDALLQPSHAIRARQQCSFHWEARGTQRACLSQDGRDPVGSQWSSRGARCTRPLTHGQVCTSGVRGQREQAV